MSLFDNNVQLVLSYEHHRDVLLFLFELLIASA